MIDVISNDIQCDFVLLAYNIGKNIHDIKLS